MLQVCLDRYVEIGRILQEWMYGPLVIALPGQQLTGASLEEWKGALVALRLHADELGLDVTKQMSSNAVIGLGGAAPTRKMAARVMEDIHRCFIAELTARVFFFAPSDRSKYYSGLRFKSSGQEPAVEPPLFGESVAASFPSALYDIKEAGNCYALGRNTACVFHLMRVIEIGLRGFAGRFGVSADHANWHNIIEGIEKTLRGMGADPNRPADWKDQQEFFSQAASHLMVIKDAWRNYTAHARGKYTDEEAETLIINVRGFMQKLSTRIHE